MIKWPIEFWRAMGNYLNNRPDLVHVAAWGWVSSLAAHDGDMALLFLATRRALS